MSDSQENQYPQFLAIDASSYEAEAHPISIAWSLSDGSIKTTMIQPEDDWQDWDYALEDLHGINQDTLFQMGETGGSVIREFEYDCNNTHFLVHESEILMELLDKLYDAYGKEPPVELVKAQDWFPENRNSYDDIQQTFFDVQNELALDINRCEDRVRIMLEAWVRQQQEQEHLYTEL